MWKVWVVRKAGYVRKVKKVKKVARWWLVAVITRLGLWGVDNLPNEVICLGDVLVF